MKIAPARTLTGTVRVPGDKSISHRAVMLASIAEGTSRIENFSSGEDCASTIRCFRQLGVETKHSGTAVVVRGVGKSGLEKPTGPLDCGNSGTTMRLLAGLLAGQRFDSVLTGDESLRRRPMNRVIEPLTKMGASLSAVDGRPPISISGGELHGIEYLLPVASAQIKSCILLAGFFAKGETTVIEPIVTRDHTERMLTIFGAKPHIDLSADGKRITVSSDLNLAATEVNVPSDISSAAFFMIAAACLPGSEVVLPNVGANPTRTEIIDVLKELGVDVSLENISNAPEPTATIRVKGGLKPTDVQKLFGSSIAAVIDEIPILAILGTQLEKGLEIRDAGELRVKETDRIAAVVENLKRMKAKVTEFDDGFRVERSDLKGAVVDSFGDHRIAMAFAIAGLLADGETTINDAECADISFPGFFETLASIVR